MNIKTMELLGLMKPKKKVKEDAPGGSVGPGGLGAGAGPAAPGNSANIGSGSVNSLGSPPTIALGVVTTGRAKGLKDPSSIKRRRKKKKSKKYEEMNQSERLLHLLPEEDLSDEDMKMELISTYSAVGDSADERRQDLEDYTEKVEQMNSEELKKHYQDSLIHPDDESEDEGDWSHDVEEFKKANSNIDLASATAALKKEDSEYPGLEDEMKHQGYKLSQHQGSLVIETPYGVYHFDKDGKFLKALDPSESEEYFP